MLGFKLTLVTCALLTTPLCVALPSHEASQAEGPNATALRLRVVGQAQQVRSCPNGSENCPFGGEFGESCKRDSNCYSGYCSHKKCKCREATDCEGCTSENAICLRIEQPSSSTKMSICKLRAFVRDSKKKAVFKIFSTGGALLESYKNLASVSEDGSSNHCVEVTNAFKADLGDIAPPGYVQSNVDTKDQDKIEKIQIETLSTESIDGGIVFLGGEWVTNIETSKNVRGVYLAKDWVTNTKTSKDAKEKAEELKGRKGPNEKKRFGEGRGKGKLEGSKGKKGSSGKKGQQGSRSFIVDIEVWPRMEVDSIDELKSRLAEIESQGRMLLFKFSGDAIWDFDIPRGVGVELVGTGPDARLAVLGSKLKIRGRLSIKNLHVDFFNGGAHVLGPTIIQHSRLTGLARCPLGFVEHKGLCFFISAIPQLYEDARERCEQFERGFLPRRHDLPNPTAAASKFVKSGRPVWIRGFNIDGQCPTLKANGKEGVGNCTSDLRHILCAATVKESFTGKRWTSYFSDVAIMDSYELLDHLASDESLPIQVDGSATVFQNDTLEVGRERLTHSLSHGRPNVVKVRVILEDGSPSDVKVALDSEESAQDPSDVKLALDSEESAQEVFFEFPLTKSSALPSKVQVHATKRVCVKSVDLFFQNNTRADLLALSYPADTFEPCIDFNVCTPTNENLCAGSLMYYDPDRKCAVLQTDNAIYPRDLALDLYKQSCSRLSTWHHLNLGEPFVMHVDYSFPPNPDDYSPNPDDYYSPNPDEAIVLEGLSTEGHFYKFKDGLSKVKLRESIRVPVEFHLSKGEGARIKSIQIKRYNLKIAGVNFRKLWGCINVCSAVAGRTGLLLGQESTSRAFLKLAEANDCDKLGELFTKDNTTGSEVCTAPAKTLTSTDEVREELNKLAPNDQPYRTLEVYVNTSSFDVEAADIKVSRGRGLRMMVDTVEVSESHISATQFRVRPFGKLSLEGIRLNGTTQITVDKGARLELAACTVAKTTTDPLVVNQGTSELVFVNVYNATTLSNGASGVMDLTYVSFYDSSNVKNKGLITSSGVCLHDDFPPWEEKVKRSYKLVSKDDELCQKEKGGDEVKSLFIDATECQSRCEEAEFCSGYMASFDDQPICHLCLSASPCEFDCSNATSIYLLAESNFNYVEVVACTATSQELTVVTGPSLEGCKQYCDYYRSCEGFKHSTCGSECTLFANLTLNTCPEDDAECGTVYIPFAEGQSENHGKVPGRLLNTNVLASHKNIAYDECAAVCSKTLFCSSYVIDDEGCTLYDKNEFKVLPGSTEESDSPLGLYVSLADTFSKKRYISIGKGACLRQVENHQGIYKANTQESCEHHCDKDFSCAAYIFDATADANVTDVANCRLLDKAAASDSIFTPNDGCDESDGVTIRASFITESFKEFGGRAFSERYVVTGLLLEKCKALCLRDTDCLAIRYDLTSKACTVGELSDGQSDTPFLALVAESAGDRSKYLSDMFCYSGVQLELRAESITTDAAFGFVKLERTCIHSDLAAKLKGHVFVANPVECGLACLAENGCKGFIYHENAGKPTHHDNCELIGGSFAFKKCDAAGLLSHLHLRADLVGKCEALCHLHKRCTAYISDDDGGCQLFSDITLLGCGADEIPKLVRVRQENLRRDVMVHIPDHCFVEFEDTLEVGCYGPFDGRELALADSQPERMTPFSCQQICYQEDKMYYAVQGSNCFCTNNEFYIDLERSDDCTTSCPGDDSQFCGGDALVTVGRTNVPATGLTLQECKEACFVSSTCNAVVFEDNKCKFRTSALFEECPQDINDDAHMFVESLEHYYEVPRGSFNGGTEFFTTSTDLSVECQRLCDLFLPCEAIRYDPASVVNNCVLLGGRRVTTADSSDGVLVSRDVNRFTRGFAPDKAGFLYAHSNVYDLDECRTICEEHSGCGSFVFENATCELHGVSSFANVSVSLRPGANSYVSYKSFMYIDEEFVVASGMCVDKGTYSIDKRMTTRSPTDCAMRCTRNRSCSVFTYNMSNRSNCILYSSDTKLVTPMDGFCMDGASTFVMYSPASFTHMPGACLKNEGSGDPVFQRKSVPECAALCNYWFNCRSFRHELSDGRCTLFTSRQSSVSSCGDETHGDLFVYESDYYYARQAPNFCAPASPMIASISGAPVEACKSICDAHESCRAVEHHQNGDCDFYATSDFSVECRPNPDRALYISTKAIANPEFFYSKLDYCLSGEKLLIQNVESQQACQDSCTENDECFGYQYSHISRGCLVLSECPPRMEACEIGEQAFLRSTTIPYQSLNNTCLRNRLHFGSQKSPRVRIYDTEEYECLSLCLTHPDCQYIIYGTNEKSDDPEIHECIFFGAQVEEPDDCAGFDSSYPYYKLTTQMVGRTQYYAPPQQICQDQRRLRSWQGRTTCRVLERGMHKTSLKLSRLLQNETTDPESLFQIFLDSPEGADSKSLRSRSARLASKVEPLILQISSVNVDEAQSQITSAKDTVSPFVDTLKRSETTLGSILNALTLVEPIPKIGQIIKALSFRKILKPVRTRVKQGWQGLEKGELALDKVAEPFTRFGSYLAALRENFAEGTIVLQGMVEYVTRASYCALRDELQDEYDRMNTWTTHLLGVVNAATPPVETIAVTLRVLDRFKADMEQKFLAVVRPFQGLIDRLTDILEPLGFMNDIMNFKLCFPFPEIRLFPPAAEMKEKCISMNGIADVLRDIEHTIKSIPLIGWVWTKVEELVETAVKAVFGTIPNFLPDFSLQVDFLDAFPAEVEAAIGEVASMIKRFTNLIDLDEQLTERIDDLLEPVKKVLDEILPNVFDLDCAEVEDEDGFQACVEKIFGFGILNEGLFPGFKFNDVSFSFPEELVDPLNQLFGQIGGLNDDLNTLFDAGFKCNEFRKQDVNFAELATAAFGKKPKELGLPNCTIPIQICADLDLPGLDAFTTKMKQRFDDLGLTTTERLLQDGNGFVKNGGMKIPLQLPIRWARLFATEIIRFVPERWVGDFVFYWNKYKRGPEIGKKKRSFLSFDFEQRIPTGSFTKKFLPEFFESTPFELFDLGVSLALGWTNDKFESALVIGSAWNFDFGLFTNYTATRQARDNLLVRKPAEIASDADFLESMASVRCRLEFYEATLRVWVEVTMNSEAMFLEGVPERENRTKNLFRDALNYYRRVGRRDFVFLAELFGRAQRTYFTELDAWLDVAGPYCERQRAELRKSHDVPFFKYHEALPEAKDCAGPERLDRLSWNDWKDPNIAKNNAWKFFKAFDFHPSVYGNLFGTGLTVSLVRRTIDANATVDETSFDVPLIGPAVVKNGDFAPCVDKALGGFPVLSLGEFFYKAYRDWRETARHQTFETTLRELLVDTPEKMKQEGTAYVQKYGLKFAWNFGSVSFTIVGDEPKSSIPSIRTCRGRFCATVGFDTVEFFENSTAGSADCLPPAQKDPNRNVSGALSLDP